jgi:hypothetical protein
MSAFKIVPRFASVRGSIRFNSSPRLTCNRGFGAYLSRSAVQAQIARRPFHNTAIMGAEIQTRVRKIVSEQLGVKPEGVRECSKLSQRAPPGRRWLLLLIQFGPRLQ